MTAIIGKWNYKEEFDFGTCLGTVSIYKSEEVYIAEFSFIENENSGSEIRVNEKCTIEIKGNQLNFESKDIDCDGLKDGEKYFSNQRQGTYTNEDKIVGHSWDSENTCGIFVMTRIENNIS